MFLPRLKVQLDIEVWGSIMEHSGFMALEDKELTIYWIWGLSSVLLVLYFSLTCNQTNSVNIPHYYLRPSHVSKWVVCLNCTHSVSSETLLLRGRPTLTPHSFKLFLRVSSTDTWVGLLADQVPSRMLGLAPWHTSKPTCQRRQWCCHCAAPE